MNTDDFTTAISCLIKDTEMFTSTLRTVRLTIKKTNDVEFGSRQARFYLNELQVKLERYRHEFSGD